MSTSTAPAQTETFLDRCKEAAAALSALMEPTPLQRNAFLSERYGADIILKREDLTPVRSYKLRGAANFFRKALTADPTLKNFVCASAGNHAQGFAYVANHYGVTGTVFMPTTTPKQKIYKTQTFGGDNITVRLIGDTFDQSYAAAKKFSAEQGATFVPPFDHPDIIEGQASVGLEILAAMAEKPDVLILPVGGGGLAAGVVQVFAAMSPDTEIVFVEPAGAPSFQKSLISGHLVTLDGVDTFVDGAAVGRMGEHTFAVLKDRHPAQVVLVPEDRVCETILEMLNIEGIVLEPAGALEIDALRSLPPERIRGRKIVCVTSGGNFDFERLPEVKERALRSAGLKKYYILRMPQRPGALRDLLDLLGPDDDITRFEYLKKSARNFGSILIGIESNAQSNFQTLTARLDSAGFIYRDITDDEVVAGVLI
ncbi:threonine ammonia-lyase IlvA [Acuticoccus sp. MNP-M23]|uniref:threonine ammonia-lyase IlvA n=1 Tax=Acuticoccus sp. MNP-M23 TaxID=3072793 RepID=UPI0028162CFA|nr:threonine ammonia-lyase IlvA [Acuticoccus sp. MNP-M23]WMS44313.1 threonine ammonia-lyase IlvA [Acuticoccus sp. MNP-M23]